MVAGDTITISGVPTGGRRDCSGDVNATHVVTLLELSTNTIIIPLGSFTTGCTSQSINLNWKGTNYSLTGVDFVVGSTHNEIGLNTDNDLQNFIGRQVHTTGTTNLAGRATIQADNDAVNLSAATSAQNCHRYIDWNGNGSTADAGDQPGWNKLTPW